MDLDQEETIATDDDSGEVDESKYFSRLMLTGHQSSSSNVVLHAALSEEISPQIDLQCCSGQSRKTDTTEQEQAHGTVVSPANPGRVQDVLNEEHNSSERERSKVVRANAIQDTISLEASQLQPGSVLRRSTRQNVTTDLLATMKSTPLQNTQLRSLPSKKKSPGTAVLNTPLPTCSKQTSLTNPSISQGWTPLHEAVNRNNYNITEVLLKAGAEVNCRGDNGLTPLHEAIQYQYCKIVDLLLKYGADPLAKCERGKTPMDMITDRSMYIMVEKYLQKTKSDPFKAIEENPPSTTKSAFNPSVRQRSCQNSVRDTRSSLKNSTRTGDTSEHESRLQSSETEPVPGPSRELPKLESSPQTSTNALFLVRDQEQDFCIQDSLLPLDQESGGSDTSSCLDSDVTVDYIEDNLSPPQNWTLCSTQDFSGSNIG